LLTRILNVAKTQAEAERGTIFLVDHKAGKIWSLVAHGLEEEEIQQPIGRGIAGHVALTGETVIIHDAYRDARFNREVDQRTGFRTRNLLCLPIRSKTGKITAVLELLNKRQGPFTDDDTDFLLALSAHVALALENAQLHRALLEKERMEKELGLARDIQRSLLPETAPLIEGFDIAVLNEPCYEVGGDYYDFLSLGPDTLLTVIADVEGKGVSSALVRSNLQAALRALVSHRPSLEEVAEGLNKIILAHTRTQKYLSIFLGLMDLRLKTLQYINCGHVPPVIVRPPHEAILLREGGLVIGMFENAQYERGQTKLEPGDILLLCTDGITESMDARQEEYGLERLIRRVRKIAEQSAAQILVSVSADVDRFARRESHIDDKVMIAIKVL
jgi:sigma-B regulation protein RsbU (phosphoserine phosphatase)